MKIKKLSIILSCFTIFAVFCLTTFHVQAQENTALPFKYYANSSESISPRVAGIDWRYKMENGKLYKRLYNHTTQEWVGDWIWCS